MTDYQDRKDIDRLFDLVWNREANEVNFASKTEFNELLIRFADLISKLDIKEEDDDEEQQIFNVASYREMLECIEDWKLPSSNTYTLFRGDCWTINNNFEANASITSTDTDNFTVTGTFRTINDMVGIYWYSEDLITHPYISYGKRSDYTGVILEFDYTMSGCTDFADTTINPSITIVDWDNQITYLPFHDYIDDGHVTIDFDELEIDVTNLQYIQFIIVPTDYEPNSSQLTIMENEDFICEVSNIEVTNAKIKDEHISLKPHRYRLCEGYDDFYNLNPFRVVREMRKLGYVDWVDLYIGASHYYEKSGTVGDVITDMGFNHNRTEKMVLTKTVPLNCAFESWLDCYSRELKANGTSKLIISVSMENLQPPTSWRQKTSSGDYAETLWIPSTFFYSPCNSEVITYMKSVSKACLDIVVDNGLQPILQMGEAWWWWNEQDTPSQPPCFYDDATKNKYYSEIGSNLPTYSSVTDTYDFLVAHWLNQQLVTYSNELRSVVKNNYPNGLYMALFFPPSVLDEDRVPSMMKDANYIVDAYSPSKLDILQLEDYDWTTGRPNVTEAEQIRDRSHHPRIYTIGQELGFTEDNLHYYGGFVQYPQDAHEYWRYIKDAMEEAFDKNFGEVFVWAGTQVRRDNKFIGHDEAEFVYHVLEK